MTRLRASDGVVKDNFTEGFILDQQPPAGGHPGLLSASVPVYLPDLTFAYKLMQSSVVVLADHLPFRVQSPVHRGRIKGPAGLQWLTVPVLQRGHSGQRIREVRIAGDHAWRRRHWKALQVNYRPTPFFDYYGDFFEGLYGQPWDFLLDLNLAILQFLTKALGISRQVLLGSEMGLGEGPVSGQIPGMLAGAGCHTYLAEKAHQKSLQAHLFVAQTSELLYIDYQPLPYSQLFGDFRGEVSVFDLIFHRGPEARHYLRDLLSDFRAG